MKKILIPSALICVLLLLSACGGKEAHAELEKVQEPVKKIGISHTYPSEVSQGRAFLFSLVSDNPFEGKLIWRNKNIPIVGQNNNGQYQAEILLAMPHNAQKDELLRISTKENVDGAFLEKSDTYTIKPLAVSWETHKLTVDSKYVAPPKSVLNRIEKERQKRAPLFGNFNAEPTWDLPFQRPVQGGISGSFGARRVFNNVPKAPHTGTDFRGATGTPIFCMADGVVVLAEDQYYSGNVVYVDHGQGVLSAYAHMSKIGVNVGDVVKKGQELGKIGMTGRVTGPHLHLGLYIQGVAVDAVPFFTEAFPPVGGPTLEDPKTTPPKK